MWTQEKTLKLIELWQKTPILWDSKHKDYRNRDLKKNALEDIAVDFDLTSLDIEKKMTGLKNQFRREHNKMKQTNSNANYSVEWFGYRPLLFLLDSFTTRETWEFLHGKKEFPELRKSSSDLCIESDIFLPTESNLMDMKEEREDPPPSVSSENEDQQSQHIQQQLEEQRQHDENVIKQEELERRDQQNHDDSKQYQKHQITHPIEEDISIFHSHHLTSSPLHPSPPNKRKKHHHHSHHNHIPHQYLEPLAILKSFPTLLNPESLLAQSSGGSSNIASITPTTSILPATTITPQISDQRNSMQEDTKPEIHTLQFGRNQKSATAAEAATTTPKLGNYNHNNNNNNNNNDRDEFSVYGDYVANCLRKYHDHHSVLVAQNKINNILFDGAIGRFSAFFTAHSALNSEHHRNQTITTLLSECSSTKRD